MFRFSFIFVFLFSSYTLAAQSSFRKLSRPEKCWVMCHPIKAKKALKITKQVQLVVDSIKHTGVIGQDNIGGNLDAFKHTYWMASVAFKIGGRQAIRLGNAHEKANYLEYKKRIHEDAILPDSVSSFMDLRNNAFGVSLVGKCINDSKICLQNEVLAALAEGKLIVIKKDEKGNFLTCDGSIIYLNDWSGKWNIPKCAIASFSN